MSVAHNEPSIFNVISWSVVIVRIAIKCGIFPKKSAMRARMFHLVSAFSMLSAYVSVPIRAAVGNADSFSKLGRIVC